MNNKCAVCDGTKKSMLDFSYCPTCAGETLPEEVAPVSTGYEGTTYDFEDGNGPVPAHRHSNRGGWVANTATVAGTAYVGGAC